MAGIAAAQIGHPVWFELAVFNADKAPVTRDDVIQRASADFTPHGVMLSKTALFTEKSALFPGSTFIVGADTLLGINELEYYDSHNDRCDAFKKMRYTGCRFLVFPRKWDNIVFDETNLEIEDQLRALCSHVSADVFIMDVSSTAIRTAVELPDVDASDEGHV